MPFSHEEVKGLIPAYVLGAVSEEEAAEIRAHVLGCESCMNEADGYAETMLALTQSVEPMELPRGFEERVLGRVREQGAAAGLKPPVVRPRRRWGIAVGYAALLAAVALVSGLLVDARTDLTANQRVVEALIQGSEGIALQGDPDVQAKVLPAEDGAVFAAVGLEDAPANKTYQLWFMKDGQPVSAGTFDASDGVAVLRTSRSIVDFDGAAVSIEPPGGSPLPTRQPFLVSG